jgi:uncharacterized protein
MADNMGMTVTVVYSPSPRVVHERTLQLDGVPTVRDAIAASGLLESFPGLLAMAPTVGVWGRKTSLGHVLRDGDRVEVYRPLLVDPKVARRQRFRQQGTRSAGLFVRKKPGA